MTGASSNLQEQIDVIGKLASRDISGVDSKALDGLTQATAALAARVVELEARTIKATHSIVMTSTVEGANINSDLVYHRYRSNSYDSAITYNKSGTLFTINDAGDCTISANLAVINANGGEIAIYYFAIRVYAGPARGMLYSEYVLGNALYRDRDNAFDSLNMGGSIRLYISQDFVDIGASFEFISVMMDGADDGTTVPSIPISTLKIEKLVFSLG